MLVDEADAGIDVQLTRRSELIPTLVETVQGYMQHERGTLEAVTQARAAAQAARNVGEAAAADAQMTTALANLFATAEAYPDLKANANALQLQEELVSTENLIAFARQAYNDAVMTYNTRLAVFPDLLIARLFSFVPAGLFEADESARALPQVEFGTAPSAR